MMVATAPSNWLVYRSPFCLRREARRARAHVCAQSKVGGPEQVAKRLIEHVRKKRALKAAASAELGCGEQRCGEHTRTLDEGDMAGNPVRRQVV